MGALERLNKLIRVGEIILQDVSNIEFCLSNCIWEAFIHENELGAFSDEWNQEVLNFLEHEFGRESAIYNSFRLQIRASYALEDEIENIKSGLAILRHERRYLRIQKHIEVHTDNT